MKISTLSPSFAAVLLLSALNPSPLRADEIQMLKNGNWNDTSVWAGGVLPAAPNAPAEHSIKITGLTGSGGNLLLNSGAGDYNILNLTYDDSISVTFRNSTDITNNNVTLNVAGNFVKNGTGTVQFTNNSNGSIRLNVAGDLVINGGKLNVGTSSSGATRLSIGGSTIVNNGTLSMRMGTRGSEASPTRLGNVTVGAMGTIELYSGANSLPTLAEYFQFTGLKGSGVISITNATTSLYTGEIMVETTGADVYSGTLIQDGNTLLRLTKSGSGSLTLSGSNNYAGLTTVKAGKLIVANTNGLGSSAVKVQSQGTLEVSAGTKIVNSVAINGGTLLINGTIENALAGIIFETAGGRIEGNGHLNTALALTNVNRILAPGEGIGTLTLDVAQTWQSFTYEWSLSSWSDLAEDAGVSYDQIIIHGGLNLTGATKINLSLTSLTGLSAETLVGFEEASRSWQILNAEGGIAGFNASIWEIDAAHLNGNLIGAWTVTEEDGKLMLHYTAVPEPTSAMLIFTAGAAALLARRRKLPRTIHP